MAVYRAYSHDVTAGMLVYQDNPVGIEVFSYVKTFFLFVQISINVVHVSEYAQ